MMLEVIFQITKKKGNQKKTLQKKAASHFFKKRENDGTLTYRQRNVLKNIARSSKILVNILKI